MSLTTPDVFMIVTPGSFLRDREESFNMSYLENSPGVIGCVSWKTDDGTPGQPSAMSRASPASHPDIVTVY